MKPGQGPPSANTSANSIEPRTTASNMILVFTDCPFDWLLRTARPGDRVVVHASDVAIYCCARVRKSRLLASWILPGIQQDSALCRQPVDRRRGRARVADHSLGTLPTRSTP